MVSGNQVKNVRLATLRGVLVLNLAILGSSFFLWRLLLNGLPFLDHPRLGSASQFPFLAMLTISLVGVIGSFLSGFRDLILFSLVTITLLIFFSPVFAFSGPSHLGEIKSTLTFSSFLLSLVSLSLQLIYLFCQQRSQNAKIQTIQAEALR